MIQELLGGAGLLAGERKISINGGGILEAATSLPHSLSPSPSPSSSTTTTNTTTNTTASAATTTASSNNSSENLRCPRCDSSNTKFCYYNNYNLTQPRHFCKTCRRYWTKGGALRNVPIGGGCRKNKSSTVVSSSAGKSISSAGKMKMVVSTEIGRGSGFGGPAGFDHDHSSSPILWGSPQNSHLLALLRSAHQNPNPNPNPNPQCSGITSLSVKEEGGSGNGMIGSHIITSSTAESTVSNGTLNLGRSLGLDPLGQVPSLGLCSSFWRSSSLSSNSQSHHHQPTQSYHQQNGFTLGEAAQSNNSGIQELYQRLRSPSSSSSASYYNDQTAVVLTHHHMGSNSSHSSSSLANSASTSTSSILESAPIGGGGELGFWNNQAFPWSDLPTTTNGAYP